MRSITMLILLSLSSLAWSLASVSCSFPQNEDFSTAIANSGYFPAFLPTPNLPCSQSISQGSGLFIFPIKQNRKSLESAADCCSFAGVITRGGSRGQIWEMTTQAISSTFDHLQSINSRCVPSYNFKIKYFLFLF